MREQIKQWLEGKDTSDLVELLMEFQKTFKGKSSKQLKLVGDGGVELDFLRAHFTCWSEWIEYKWSQFKFKYKAEASELKAIKQLEELSGGDKQKAQAIVNNSIANGYKGLFEIKEKSFGQKEKTTFINVGEIN